MDGDVADGVFLAALAAAAALALPRAALGLLELARGVFGSGALARASEGPARRAVLARAVLVLFFLYLPLTAVAFALSDLRMGDHAWPMESAGYRYFLPTFLFGILLVALTAARLWRRSGAARLAGAVLVIAAFAAGCFDLALIEPSSERAGEGIHRPGHNFRQTARSLFLPSNGLAHDEVVRIAESFPPRLREEVYFGLGFYEAFRADLSAFPPELDPAALLSGYAPERLPDLARGIGARMRHLELTPGELPPEAWSALARYASTGHPLAEPVAEGLCAHWAPRLARETPVDLESDLALLGFLRERVPALWPAALRGFGHQAGRLVRRGMPYELRLVRAAAERLDGGGRGPFFEGLGMGLADGHDRPALPAALAEWVTPDQVGAVQRGLARRLAEIHGGRAEELAAELPRPPGW